MMKRKWIVTVLLAALLLAVGLLCGCSQWETPYSSLDKDGHTVSVRFDANGGVFAGTKDVFVVDVFNPENGKTGADGMKEIALIAPDDERRGDGAFEVSRTKCFLAGWYTQRIPRVNEAGEPLDEYGVPTAVSGRPQGYEYAGKWDFSTDRVKVDPNGSYTAEENVLTLYAAWVPYFSFEFYKEEADGSFSSLGTVEALELSLPSWDEKTGAMNMQRFPKVEGMTFVSAYADAEKTTPITEKLGGAVDYDKGIASAEKIPVYTTWRKGEWYRIQTVKQFQQSAVRPGACLELMADLDFAGEMWPPSLAFIRFSGMLEGNGHKISNVNVVQADNSKMIGGLFGALESNATLRNVSFENISYTILAGSRLNGASFGLLAGSVAEGATLTGVTVSGSLLIDRACHPQTSAATIGVLFGNGVDMGVSAENVTVALTGTDTVGQTATIAVDAAGNVTLQFS